MPARKLASGITMIDAHLHVWDLTINAYPWLTPELGRLYATYSPEQARAEMAAVGVQRAVLVQAENSASETRYLLELASAHDFVAGVVGWIPLDDPNAARSLLAKHACHPRFVGVRHLVHDDPRADLLDSPPAREAVGMLAQAGYPFDVPDAWPRHLTQVERLAADIPSLVIVVDHLAKPPRGRADFEDWHAAMRRVAAHENTVAKFSGLRIPGQPYTIEALQPVWDIALELFGPERLMFGSDWPMTVPHGGYGPTFNVLAELVAPLPAEQQALVMGGTARRIYRLDDTAA